VNPGIDEVAAIQKYWKEGKFSFDTIRTAGDDPTMRKFGVHGFPTNYLIGKDGKILWRGLGFDESALHGELSKLGIAKR
jgi:hypothetical protein